MRFKSALFVILFSLTSLVGLSGAAEAKTARVGWNGVTLQVVSNLPASWDVKGAMSDLDWYTGSRFVLVKSCSSKYRCVVISSGKTAGAEVGLAHGCISRMMVCQITVDVQKAGTAKYKKYFNASTKRWLIRHELGHYRGLQDRKACDSTMNPYVRCKGHTPPNTFSASERSVLRRM